MLLHLDLRPSRMGNPRRSGEGSPRRKWATIQSAFGEVSGREVEVEIRRHDKEALEFDVTRCRFAELFRTLGEPELGARC
jgi:hypothetical protein